MAEISSTLVSRIASTAATQEAVAIQAGYEPTAFSRILRGLRKPPPGFEDRVYAALDALECAEMAAEEARRRVLAQHAARRRPQRHERRKGTGESPARIRAMAMPGAAS